MEISGFSDGESFDIYSQVDMIDSQFDVQEDQEEESLTQPVREQKFSTLNAQVKEVPKHIRPQPILPGGCCMLSDSDLKEIAETELLPETFTVYTNGRTVINHPFGGPGFEACELPIFNDYTGPNGGYVALYSQQKEGSIYSVGNGIYVMGQVRIPGEYQGRIFVPEGYQLGDNITRDENILETCKQYFPNLEDFWIGGDTGGWYGIQP